MPNLPQDAPFDMPEHLKEWFIRAVATESTERFASIDDMKKAFSPPTEVKIEKSFIVDYESEKEAGEIQVENYSLLKSSVNENEFLQYLNSLSNVFVNENATADSQVINNILLRYQYESVN